MSKRLEERIGKLNVNYMKKYKVRLNCHSFVDVVVIAVNQKQAVSEAYRVAPSCPQDGFDFGEFLEVSEDDEPEN